MPEPEAHEVTVEVYAPRFTEPKKFTWSLDLTVGAAAKQAAEAFGIQGGNPTLGTSDGKPFPRDETLLQAHVHNHQKLELLDVGGGVRAPRPRSVSS